MSTSEKIIENLKGRVHGVNAPCALAGTEMTAEDFAVLNELVEQGTVRVEYFCPDPKTRLPLYRLARRYRPFLKVVE